MLQFELELSCLFCPYRFLRSCFTTIAVTFMLLLGLSVSPLPVSGSLKRVVRSIYDVAVKKYLITDMKYGLTDKVVHSYNDFCQDLAITSNSVPKNLHSNATLYLLSQHPPRTDHEIISGISKQMLFSRVGSRSYYSYNYTGHECWYKCSD